MTLNALLSATLCALAPNVKWDVKRQPALNAWFTANAPSALFVAPRTIVKRKTAPSARLSVLLLNDTPLVLLPNPNAHLFARNSNATTSVSNPLTANVPSASFNARSLLVKRRSAALAVHQVCNWPSFKPTMLAILLLAQTLLPSWKPSTLSDTPFKTELKSAALAPPRFTLLQTSWIFLLFYSFVNVAETKHGIYLFLLFNMFVFF